MGRWEVVDLWGVAGRSELIRLIMFAARLNGLRRYRTPGALIFASPGKDVVLSQLRKWLSHDWI